jgi:hypothetical protein
MALETFTTGVGNVTDKINSKGVAKIEFGNDLENTPQDTAREIRATGPGHADKEQRGVLDERFFLDENEDVVDRLNPVRGMSYYYYGDDHPNQFRLRESILRRHLDQLVSGLIPNCHPEETDRWGYTYQPFNYEEFEVSNALFEAIRASHLNALEPRKAAQVIPEELTMTKSPTMQGISSLSLFRDDVEHLLRELYDVFDSDALDSILCAVLQIIESFSHYIRKDLWQEHHDAKDWDYILGVGVPDGCGISGSDHRRGLLGLENLRSRVRDVRKNPSAYGKYTVEFAKRFEELANLEDDVNWIAERSQELAQLRQSFEANGFNVSVTEDDDGVHFSVF